MLAGLALLGALLGGAVAGLYPLARRLRAGRRLAGWLMLLGLLAAAGAISQPWGVWLRMVATWQATFVGFKALLLLHHSPARLAGLTWWRYLGFFAWVGMDIDPWTRPRQPVPAALVRERLRSGGALALAGLGLAAVLLAIPLAADSPWRLARAWCALVAMIIGSFFGATRMLTATWNDLGRPVEPLFDRPVYASSLADWWGKRWNLAVHTVLGIAIWRPLRARLGASWAASAVFLASGLLHEYLLSYLARGGWGGPTAYFAIQAAAMAIERRIRLPDDWRRPLWTLSVTLLPGPLLFHPPLLQALFD